MSFSFRKVAVLGAGVMGGGIAAHLANAGVPCLLLDIVPPSAAAGEDTSSRAFRNKFATSGRDLLKKLKPAPIISKAALDIIDVGNFDDDIAKIADCDWVIEVVKEDLAIKQKVFANVEKYVRPNTIVSSNTSGLSIKGMLEGRGEAFKKHFLVTHFFNPVRYMKLLELVSGEETLPEVVAAIHKFGEETLGKGIVYGKDTTNFIANRIGVFGMMKTIDEMKKAELSVEEVDKIFGPAMGRPKSAVFRTADIVGLDTFVHVSQNCYDSLPNDEERDVFKIPAFIKTMVEKGMLGQKSGAGFYKKVGKDILTLDLNTLEYKAQGTVRFDSLGEARRIDDPAERVVAVMNGNDKAAKFAEVVTLNVLAYASRRIPEIADDLVNIDRGLRWGFGWDVGPFEIWNAYGVQAGLDRMKELGIKAAPWVAEMVKAGTTSFYAIDDKVDVYWDIPTKKKSAVPMNRRQMSVELLKRSGKPIKKNNSGSVWDMGDGCALLEFHSKMNSIDDGTVEMMNAALDIAEKDFKGLVIGNDAANFSVGANIMALLWAANSGQWEAIRKMVTDFQMANQRMYYSRIPVVTAPSGMALGGGCEVTMGGNAVQAAVESYIGLVEVGVGLIPGGGGNMMLLRNLYGPVANDPIFDAFPYIQKAFMSIGMGAVATSAEEAREKGFLKPTDGISMNRDFLLSDAKQKALGMADGFLPPRPTQFLLPGKSGAATVDMLLYDMQLNGQISEHDRHIGKMLASVLTGGDTTPKVLVSEDRLLELEREAFLSLCGESKTKARISYMLEKGKPLRN